MTDGSGIARNKISITRMFFISLCIILGVSLCHASDTSDAINNYKELKSNFINYKNNFSEARPEPISHIPKDNPSSFRAMRVSPVNEKIALTGADPRERVPDIEAINSAVERTIDYDDVQLSDGTDHGNAINIEIAGDGQDDNRLMDMDDDVGGAIEENVDAAIGSSRDNGLNNKSQPSPVQSNNLNIDVSDISVTAINTVDGGSATAVSNIIIEPVQIINPSEVCEKLR